MNTLTYIFPIATLLLIFLFFLGLPAPCAIGSSDNLKSRFSRRDVLALSLITILYAVVAFYNLGDTNAPQSFYHFDKNESVTVDLGDEYVISKLMYYSGLNTGSYALEYSVDGVNWQSDTNIEQNYVSLFKWKTAESGLEFPTVRFIRITADREMYLGELAVFSADAELISGDIPQLFDEQSVVPQKQTYLNSTYFDEIYHARTAFENVEGIYPYEISHPPLGKLIIAIGIELFGMTPFGWRFSGAFFGVLMLPILYVFLKKLFGGTTVPACGTAIFAFDFMHFTQTRIATIDTYAVFFVLLMYLFMYLYLNDGRLRYLALSGLFFGIGAACKWTCFYAGAGLAVIWLVHWIRNFELKAFIKNCLFCIVFFVLVPGVIYYASYFPYGIAQGLKAPKMFLGKEYADIVLRNQEYMFSYHSGVHSEHPYSSRWYQWIFDLRPILYYLDYGTDGTRSSFGAFLNPVLCWAGLLSMFVMGGLSVLKRDKKAAFILVGYLAQLLPWVFITRTTFEYHYFPSAVFLTLALCYVFSLMQKHDKDWKIRVYGLTALSLVLFAAFYPVLSGAEVNETLARSLLKWLPTWPF